MTHRFPVGASLLAKVLVHPPNSECLKYSLREQARSHKKSVRPQISDRSHAERGDDRRRVLSRWIDGAQTGPFPAEAGPTNGNACSQSVSQSVSQWAGFSREAVDLLLLCSCSASDLHTQKAQTPHIATWVQAERRSRAVGRAAWMPREPPPAMDGGWRRAHGARPE